MHIELEHALPIHGNAFLIGSHPHHSITVSIQCIDSVVRQAPGVLHIIRHINHLPGFLVEDIDAPIILPYPDSSLPVLRYRMDKI